ncbi:MAG: hypothetical protein L0216_20535 [Planctomycetales bacterium]|nr:hypothetical protein [Planctomycetales bacterium]
MNPMPRARPTRRPGVPRPPDPLGAELNPWWEEWIRLRPWQRIVRSWRLRSRLPDPARVHDEKTYPEL